MVTARGKQTPAKKRAVVDDGEKAPAPRKPTRRAAEEPVRVPRSTKRNTFADARSTTATAKRGGPEARPGRRERRVAGDAVNEAGRATAPVRGRRARIVASPRALSVERMDRSGDLSPLRGGSVSGPTPRMRGEAYDEAEPDVVSHVMELHWGDDGPQSRRSESRVQRWVKRGDALLRHLAEHGAARHEYRADLREGRFVWVDPEGRVSAEAQATVLCSWSPSTLALAMAWADPVVRDAGVARLEGLAGERDDVDEETAWRVAMEAADHASADYLYRVITPHAWYFLALKNLGFHPEQASWNPGTPVGLVLRGLSEIRRAVESRAEPADVVRDRLSGLGQALLFEAQYAYRDTDWVARLERAGRRLVTLEQRIPRASFNSVAAGRSGGEWLDRQATLDVSDALALLEDEWSLFA